MNAENKKPKKRKRNFSPVVKSTLIIIVMVVAGFLTFYSIDNPGVLKSKFSSLFGKNESEEEVPNLSETGEGKSSNNIEESVTVSDSSSNETENIDSEEANSNEGSDDSETGSSLSLWQRIKNFFIRQKNREEEEEIFPAKLEVNFYFMGLGEDKKLVSEKRTIIAGNPETAVKNAIQELLNGPDKSYHFPVIPAGTKLIGVETNEKIAKVNFSQEFLENSLDTRILDEYIIYSIVNTITEIPEIEGVIFNIEGIRIKVYGNVDLSVPAIRNKEYISEIEQ